MIRNPKGTMKPCARGLWSAPLWIHQQHGGLQGKLPLFEAFEKDVEKTDQILAKSKKP
jgi:hypothetical protein